MPAVTQSPQKEEQGLHTGSVTQIHPERTRSKETQGRWEVFSDCQKSGVLRGCDFQSPVLSKTTGVQPMSFAGSIGSCCSGGRWLLAQLICCGPTSGVGHRPVEPLCGAWPRAQQTKCAAGEGVQNGV